MSEWQPIETAPKDGYPYLFFYPNGIGMTRYSARYWATGEWRVGAKTITEGWSDEWRQLRLQDEPSHWMPLPEPPK
jgi:hypothetical protein